MKLQLLCFFLSLLVVYSHEDAASELTESMEVADYEADAYNEEEVSKLDEPVVACGLDLLHFLFKICSSCRRPAITKEYDGNPVNKISDFCCLQPCRPSFVRELCCEQNTER